MLISEILSAEVAVQFCKMIIEISRRLIMRKSAAEKLNATVDNFLKIVQEIKYSGVELPQHRQLQLDLISQKVSEGIDLAKHALASGRWNVYKNVRFSRKMEKLERLISHFVSCEVPMHILADVHHMRRESAERFDRLDAANRQLEKLKIGAGSGGGWLWDALRRADEDEAMIGLGNFSVTIAVGKKKLKELILTNDSRPVGIHGMGGSGKTTLAREVCRDGEVTNYFNNRILFLTVSQSPNVEQMKETIWRYVSGNSFCESYDVVPPWNLQYQWKTETRTLIVLDDVWTLGVLEQLICKVPGCKTLVVSRFEFPTVLNHTYEVELLREDEALAVFCYYAFGIKTIPFDANDNLVKQVVRECKCLPLALKVVGASLRDRPQMFWASAKSRLLRGEVICESHQTNLLERMAVSVNYLSNRVRECFLDLGAFPEDKKIPLDVLVNIWVEIHDLDEEEAFAVLVELSEKNLLTLLNDSRAGDIYSSYCEISVTQHDVLRDLALHMNGQGNINERKRLMMPQREAELPKEWQRNSDLPFSAQVVSVHTGDMKENDWFQMKFPQAEVLIINFSSPEYFLPPFVSNMPKLKALILINYGNMVATLHNVAVLRDLPNLRSLWFEKISIPDLSKTHISFTKLKKISLVLCKISNSYDQSVVDLPHILPSLSELTLDHCDDISRLPSNMSELFSLKALSITNCHSLQELPVNLGKLKSLQILRIYACPSLRQLPLSTNELVSLKYLDISQCVGLQCLPGSIDGLVMLEKINMSGCLQIRDLPESVIYLQSLSNVVCDEDISWLWKDQDGGRMNLKVQIAKESFNLDWLSE
uniref:RPW8 domain-containing protein n=1 Tax=Kalanchoe fedtschenkoi TaxID=63787 RepID=A0A7N0V426_KALFE